MNIEIEAIAKRVVGMVAFFTYTCTDVDSIDLSPALDVAQILNDAASGTGIYSDQEKLSAIRATLDALYSWQIVA